MTKQQVANSMLKDLPWDGTELATPLSLPGALLAPSYIEQKQITKPANPPTGSTRLYPKADGKFYQLDSAGSEIVISGQTQAQNDARYLQLTGGALSGPLTVTNLTAQNIVASGDLSASNVIATAYKWTPATDGESLYKEMSGRLRLSGAMLTVDQNLNVGTYEQFAEVAAPVTPNTGFLRLYGKSDHRLYIKDVSGAEASLLTAVQADTRYDPLGIAASGDATHIAAVDPHPIYLTAVEGDARYATNPGGPSGGYLTTSAADVTYLKLAGGTLTGSLLFSTDNTVDIGASGATRPRNLYVGGNVFGGSVGSNFQVQAVGVDLRLVSTTGNIVFSPGGTQRWRFDNATGSFLAVTDNATDIGASGANRPRDLFLGRNLVASFNVSAVGALTTGIKAGTPVDADVVTPADGMLRVDSSSNQLYFRSSGVWTQSGTPLATTDARYLQLAGGTLTGTLNFVTANEYVRYFPGTAKALTIVSTDGYLGLSTNVGVQVTHGAYYDGTNWQRFNTGIVLGHMNVGNAGINFYTAPAGTGVPAWSQKWAVDAAGAMVAVGDIRGRWLYTSDGSNGVVLAGAGDLYLRNATAANTYRFDTGASIAVTGGATFGNHVMISQATGGIGSAGASEGQLELQNAGSGAAKIAFHRTGAYAAYFGLDTDNIWAVGGWSTGAVRYPIHHDGNYPVSQSASNSTLVQRTVNGYIYSNYINCSADVPSGRPAYVWGDNGDQFARRWPIAAIGPPSLWYYQGGINSAVAVPRTGYYMVWLRVGQVGGSNCGDANGTIIIYRNGAEITRCNWQEHGGYVGAGEGPFICNAGDNLSCGIFLATTCNYCLFTVCSVPSTAYPG
jgi:hypothetical protein